MTLFGRTLAEIQRSAVFGSMGHFRTFKLVIWGILGHLVLTRLKYPYVLSPCLSMFLGLSFGVVSLLGLGFPWLRREVIP